MSEELRTWCNKNNIKIDNSPPEGQHTNGYNERHWGTVQKMARKMLVHSRLSIRFFMVAAKYACHIHNVLPVKNLTKKDGTPTTPYELFHGKTPKISHYRVFGCPMIYKKNQKDKWDLQEGKRGIFIGFPDQQSGWLVYSPHDGGKDVAVTKDAVFDESFITTIAMRPMDVKVTLPIRHTGTDKDIDDDSPESETEFEHTGNILST